MMSRMAATAQCAEGGTGRQDRPKNERMERILWEENKQ